MTYSDAVRIAIELHRDDPPPLIQITLPADRLMNDDHCVSLEKRLEEVGGGWEVRIATPALGDMIPNTSGLYMFVWRPAPKLMIADRSTVSFPQILYVGRAGDESTPGTLRARYKGEYSKYIAKDPERLWRPSNGFHTRRERLSYFLQLNILEYWWLVVEQREHIKMLESRLQRLFCPPVNDQGTPRLRPKPRRKAF